MDIQENQRFWNLEKYSEEDLACSIWQRTKNQKKKDTYTETHFPLPLPFSSFPFFHFLPPEVPELETKASQLRPGTHFLPSQ